MYFYQQEYDKALEFNFKKLPLSSKAGNDWEASKTLNNISNIYSARMEYDSSLYFLRSSLALNRKMNFSSGVAGSYQNIGSIMLLKGEIDSALYYVNQAVEIYMEINDPGLSTGLITLGHIYMKKSDYNRALTNALSGYNLATEQHDPIIVSKGAVLLSDLYKLTGRDDLAYKFFREYHIINDSINNNEFLKKVTRLEIQSEYDQKQREAELEQMNELLVRENKIDQQEIVVRGLIILIFMLVIIMLFYIRNSRLKASFANIDLEQRLLRSQMNPHFIFNSLCAVQDFILDGKPEKANSFLVKIASLMRNILENSREEYISLDTEIETLKLYLDIQQMRFKDGFKYSFSVDKAIDIQNLAVPPMLAQPSLENSIEHGLLPMKGMGRIDISYRLKGKLVMLEVSDNGVGLSEARDLTKVGIKKHSLSTLLTRNRLEYFKKRLKTREISYQITDLFDKTKRAGTRVVIVMPCRKIFS
jgi:tetratricopeptide (TPR) repeat protein